MTKSQRLPIDFDSVPVDVLNEFPYAVTTSAIYQSQAPPGWTLAEVDALLPALEADRDHAADRDPLRGGAAGPGLRCNRPKLAPFQRAGGEALTWQPRTVIAKRLYWKAGGHGGALGEGGVAPRKQRHASTTTWRRARPRARRSRCRPAAGSSRSST